MYFSKLLGILTKLESSMTFVITRVRRYLNILLLNSSTILAKNILYHFAINKLVNINLPKFAAFRLLLFIII